jgi:hypothetical protein
MRVGILVCGAVSRPLQEMLAAYDIRASRGVTDEVFNMRGRRRSKGIGKM